MFNFSNYNPRNSKILLKNFLLKFFYKGFSLFKRLKKFVFRDLFRKKLWFRISVLCFVFLSVFYFLFVSPPFNFPVGRIIEIEEGATLKQVAELLEKNKVIKSSLMFSGIIDLFLKERGAIAGDYFFEERCTVFKIIWRTTSGIYGITPTKITFVEGSTIYDIADVIGKKFPKFDKREFIKIAQDEEGFLFPDTYYFLPNVTPQSVISTMKSNFNKRIEEISDKIDNFGKDIHEIVTMASLLEKEARTLNSKRMIAGILWKRIEIEMPLQVDAVFPYIIGKNTYQLSLDDLKVESPYNTYTNKGLPVGPIANPSLWSLLAAVTPIESDYLFYLSDEYGNMHYAVDFEQHKQNKRLYLY